MEKEGRQEEKEKKKKMKDQKTIIYKVVRAFLPFICGWWAKSPEISCLGHVYITQGQKFCLTCGISQFTELSTLLLDPNRSHSGFPVFVFPNIIGFNFKKFLVYPAYHRISALCKANETSCPWKKNSKLSQGISFMDALSPPETENFSEWSCSCVVEHCVTGSWATTYKRDWINGRKSHHIIACWLTLEYWTYLDLDCSLLTDQNTGLLLKKKKKCSFK